jgi:hypothetical protein
MSRGFKRNHEATAQAGFHSKASFISLDGHLVLYGADKKPIRLLIYQRDRGICRECGHTAGWFRGEWHHVANEHNNFRRCDCPEGGEWVCGPCHRKKHVLVQLKPLESHE